MRLIDAKLASTRQRQAGENTPALIPWFATAQPTIGHAGDETLHIVDHEIDFVFTALLGWMDRDLGRRQRKDKPALSDVHMREAQHVAEKGAIRLSVRAVNDHVSACYRGHRCSFRPAKAGHYAGPAEAGHYG
jgi:hypothetical protein